LRNAIDNIRSVEDDVSLRISVQDRCAQGAATPTHVDHRDRIIEAERSASVGASAADIAVIFALKTAAASGFRWRNGNNGS
jgi:hypothetical protein